MVTAGTTSSREVFVQLRILKYRNYATLEESLVSPAVKEKMKRSAVSLASVSLAVVYLHLAGTLTKNSCGVLSIPEEEFTFDKAYTDDKLPPALNRVRLSPAEKIALAKRDDWSGRFKREAALEKEQVIKEAQEQLTKPAVAPLVNGVEVVNIGGGEGNLDNSDNVEDELAKIEEADNLRENSPADGDAGSPLHFSDNKRITTSEPASVQQNAKQTSLPQDRKGSPNVTYDSDDPVAEAAAEAASAASSNPTPPTNAPTDIPKPTQSLQEHVAKGNLELLDEGVREAFNGISGTSLHPASRSALDMPTVSMQQSHSVNPYSPDTRESNTSSPGDEPTISTNHVTTTEAKDSVHDYKQGSTVASEGSEEYSRTGPDSPTSTLAAAKSATDAMAEQRRHGYQEPENRHPTPVFPREGRGDNESGEWITEAMDSLDSRQKGKSSSSKEGLDGSEEFERNHEAAAVLNSLALRNYDGKDLPSSKEPSADPSTERHEDTDDVAGVGGIKGKSVRGTLRGYGEDDQSSMDKNIPKGPIGDQIESTNLERNIEILKQLDSRMAKQREEMIRENHVHIGPGSPPPPYISESR